MSMIRGTNKVSRNEVKGQVYFGKWFPEAKFCLDYGIR